MIKRTTLWVLLLLLLPFGAAAQDSLPAGQQIRVSLLTCAPGGEVYEQYGHTAIRIQDPSRQLDAVFNYGMFSFNTPHFVWRFIKGETDYQLGVMPYSYFEAEYATRGSSVYEQTLNLTPAEKLRLLDLLEDNYQPAHRTYRYNFLYDNCTTRARDMIEKAVDGRILYAETTGTAETDKTDKADKTDNADKSGKEDTSYRDIIHEHTSRTPWTRFGIDCLLGAEADVPITQRQRQFAPFHLLRDLRQARVQRADSLPQPFVLTETKIVEAGEPVTPADAEGWLSYQMSDDEGGLTPAVAGVLLLMTVVAVAVCQVRQRRHIWLMDILLYALLGLAGIVVGLLFFASTHPTVGSNWLILLLNPIPMLCLPWTIYRVQKRRTDWFNRLYAAYLTLFIIFIPLIPQKFDVTVVTLALGLLVNCGAHLWVTRLKQQNGSK
jgi:hypothetical protein